MTRKALALRLLRAAGADGVTTAEFLEAGVGSRYGGRVHELRADGHEIEAKRIRDGSWRYTLVTDAEDVGGAGALESTDSSCSDPGPSGGLFDAEEYRERRRYGFEEAA